MALRCGHYTKIAQEERVRLVESGRCPVCPNQALEPHTEWVRPYGQCGCCGERWIVESEKVATVVFA